MCCETEFIEPNVDGKIWLYGTRGTFEVDGVGVPTNFHSLSLYRKLALGRTSSKKPWTTDNHRVGGWGVAVYKMDRLRSTILKKK